MSTYRQPWVYAVAVLASLVWIGTTRGAEGTPAVHVNAEVTRGVVRLVAQATGPFEYTSSHPGENLLVLELSGVTADAVGAHVVDSDLVSGYRVISVDAGAKPIVRMEILLRGAAKPRIERTGDRELAVVITRAADDKTPPTTGKESEGPGAPFVSGRPLAVPVIEKVQLEQNGTQTEIHVKGTARLNYKVARLSNPDRIVLDFTGVRLRTGEKSLPSNLDPVKRIRMAQFTPEVARVVIDLREAAKYSVISSGSGVTVDFVASAVPASAKPQSRASVAGAAQTRPVPASSLIVPAVALPASLTQPSAALAARASKEKDNATAAIPGPVAVFANSKRVAQSEQNPQAAPAAPPAPPPQAAPSGGKYTGEPISVNLKDVDLRDFFRLIHEISGLNVVVDPAVKGSLTIVLDDVPWDQALDIVLKNNDLEKQLDGNVLRIATRETVKKEAEEQRDLAKAQAEAADVVTTTRTLSYAKSDDMVNTLKKFLSSRGDILSDTRSNTLIIRDVPSFLPVIDNLIRQLDRKSQQVEIEARVVAANRTFARDIGTQFAFSYGSASRNNVVGGALGPSPFIRNPPLPAPPLISTGGTGVSQPLVTNLGASAPTSGVTYGYSSRNFALDLIITAAESKGIGKLLSRPKLITQNNEKALVKQGTKIPVQTIINNTISVQFVDAVLQLEVTPHITAEGTVFMDVDVTNNQIDNGIPRILGIPAIDVQQSTTKVTAGDGETVVIGGVIISNQRTDITQVPLFGSLPLIGNLFKRTNVSTTSQELLFFLTPRILPS